MSVKNVLLFLLALGAVLAAYAAGSYLLSHRFLQASCGIAAAVLIAACAEIGSGGDIARHAPSKALSLGAICGVLAVVFIA